MEGNREIRYHKKSDNGIFDFFTGNSVITKHPNRGKNLLRTGGMQKIKINIETKNHCAIKHYICNKKITLK